MTLPVGFEVNINVPWVDVNMTWDVLPWRDAAFVALQDHAVKLQADAEAAWAAEFPHVAMALNPTVDGHVLAYLGPWAVPPPTAALDAWLLDATTIINHDTGIHDNVRVQAHAVLRHRFANETMRRAVQPTVQPALDALQAWRAAHTARQFCNHTANKPGVLIDVAARGDQPRRVLLIGDTVPSGVSSGCCTEGIADEDVVLRYRDLREFIDAARAP